MLQYELNQIFRKKNVKRFQVLFNSMYVRIHFARVNRRPLVTSNMIYRPIVLFSTMIITRKHTNHEKKIKIQQLNNNNNNNININIYFDNQQQQKQRNQQQ